MIARANGAQKNDFLQGNCGILKKAPLVILIIISSILFTVMGIVGIGNIYATQEQDPFTTPFLSRVFTGINDGIYPWDIFDSEKREEARKEALAIKEKEERMLAKQEAEAANEEETSGEGETSDEEKTAAEPEPLVEVEPIPTPSPTPEATPTPTPEATSSYTPRYAPLRESTYDEYITHVSADIYGDAGVLFAAEYPFKKVDISYFDDALFIGDSRTVGLRDYTDVPEHADFLCETSLTIWKVFESDFGGKGTVEEYLTDNSYGKIYLMVGVNELGRGTSEDFIAQYTEVVDRIHELQPEAYIFVQAIMNIDRTKSESDDIFNNQNIMGRNHAIATLADNVTFFYIDVNEAVCDEDGFLREDLRGDHLHLLGKSNEVWREFLLEHGV